MEEKVNKIIKWIFNYVKSSKAKGVVIGNSGGKDSAVVIALCAKALGKENVLAVELPCYSRKGDLDDGILVAKTFGIKNIIVDITKTYNELEMTLGKEIDILDEAKINIKPRLRMASLYAIAQSRNYLVVGTSNLCEIYVGYTTKWGDSASDFNPIANFTVQEVIEIGNILGVPKEILNKVPDDGLGSGSDEEKLGVSYEKITEYIKTGKVDKNSEEIIKSLHKKTAHKRKTIPTYGG